MVRVIAGFLRNQAKVDAQVCAAVFLVLDLILSRYNIYGFCFVAVYGLAFSDASGKAGFLSTSAHVVALETQAKARTEVNFVGVFEVVGER